MVGVHTHVQTLFNVGSRSAVSPQTSPPETSRMHTTAGSAGAPSSSSSRMHTTAGIAGAPSSSSSSSRKRSVCKHQVTRSTKGK